MFTLVRRSAAAAFITCSAFACLAADAPGPVVGFRYDGTGHYPDAKPVTEWSLAEKKNVRWQTPMPSATSASPIVTGNLVVTMSEPDLVIGVDVDSGAIRWQMPLRLPGTPAAAPAADAKPIGYGNPGVSFATPASDGRHIFATSGTGVVASLNLDGTVAWTKNFPARRGASPLLSGENLLVFKGNDGRSCALVALAKADGAERWTCEGLRAGAMDFMHAMSSPVLCRIGDVALVVTPGGALVRASDGKVLLKDIALGSRGTSPQVSGNTAVWATGNRPSQLEAFQVSVDGETATAKPLWQTPHSGYVNMCPVIHNGLVFLVALRRDTLEAYDLQTGKLVKSKTFSYMQPEHTMYGRPVIAGAYLFAQMGDDHLVSVKPDATLEAVGDGLLENMGSTPFFSGDRIYVRTYKSLICLGPK